MSLLILFFFFFLLLILKQEVPFLVCGLSVWRRAAVCLIGPVSDVWIVQQCLQLQECVSLYITFMQCIHTSRMASSRMHMSLTLLVYIAKLPSRKIFPFLVTLAVLFSCIYGKKESNVCVYFNLYQIGKREQYTEDIF